MVHHFRAFRAVFSRLPALSLVACANTVEVVGDPQTNTSTSDVQGSESPGACASYEGTGCYWMENTSGNYCWIPAGSSIDYGTSSIDECFALDSCDGGLSQSGGGCYKWADGSDDDRYPWH